MKSPILDTHNLKVSFEGFIALDLDYFTLREGELRVIIGPNGAGKTTFLDVLCGKTKPTSGTVTMNGENILNKSEREIVELGVGRKFQTPSVFGSLSVKDNMVLALKYNRNIFSSIFYRPNGEVEERIEYVAEKVGLSHLLTETAGALSHGQKQWLELAIVILQKPRLLLVDEPAAGMSDKETERTGELLLELAQDHTIIVIEHDMEFVRQIASIVTVLARGKLLAQGPMSKVQNDPQVIEQYLGKRHAKEVS